MKKIAKKNQIIISALAIMIAIAGYLSFTNKDIKILDENGNQISLNKDEVQETLQPDTGGVVEVANEEEGDLSTAESLEESKTDMDANTIETNGEVTIAGADGNQDDAEVSAPVEDSIGEAVLTNTNAVANVANNEGIIVSAKINREQARSKTQEMLMQIVNSDSLDDATKQEAVDELVGITEKMEKESVCEQQLLARGFGECVVLINDGSVDVTVNKSELTEMEKAQIEDIITRKAECNISDVVITMTAN